MKRAIIIEDQVILRDFVRTLIEAMPDVEVVGESGDGLEGFKLVQEHHPDLLVLDIVLPGLNGVSFMKRLKLNYPEINVLCLSSFTNPDIIRDLIQSGAMGLVQKSEKLDILEAAIKLVANGQTYLSPNVTAMMREMMMHPDRTNSPSDLTERECEILQLVAESCSNKEIAAKLNISIKTVETHRNHIMTKLDIHDAAGLTRFAIAHGLLDLSGN